jgi:hypothetical protein
MYIDGYNFYYSIKHFPGQTPIHLGWCNFQKLAEKLMLPPNGALSRIKYFAPPVAHLGEPGGPAGSEAARQSIWLGALKYLDLVEILERCHRGDRPKARKEKQTDVNIGVTMVADAAEGHCDRALLVTGDLDQVPAVKAVVTRFHKKVDVWLPPNRDASPWKFITAYPGESLRSNTPAMLRETRLPNRIETADGVIEAPKVWRGPP